MIYSVVPQHELTLARIPHQTQVAIQALLFVGHSGVKISKALGVSQDVVGKIRRELPSNSLEVETFKKDLINRSYSIAHRSMIRVSDEKLDACSAPQLAMVSGIFIDKARDMEGLNKPVFNVVDIAMSIEKLTIAARQRLDAINTQLTATDQPSDLT